MFQIHGSVQIKKPENGRSRAEQKVMISAKVAASIVKQIDDRAFINHRTRSEEIGYLLEIALKTLPPEKNDD